MPNYDRQAIVQADPDQTIAAGSNRLTTLGQSKDIATAVVDFPVAGHPDYHAKVGKLSDALRPLTKDSRLYIRGHGSWCNQTVGGVGAKDWARSLLNAGLYRVKLISICACQAGRDLLASDNGRVAQSADSFASQFHQALMDMSNLTSVVYARVYNVSVYPAGFKSTSQQALNIKPANSRAKSKVKFTWEGRKQKREWINYADGGTTAIDTNNLDPDGNVLDYF